MATVDISKLSYADLQKLLVEAQEAVDAKRDEEIKTLVNGFKLKIDKAGIDVADVIAELQHYLPKARTAKVAGAPKPVMYRDPAHPESTWSGRGRMARWLQAYVNEGKRKEDYLVK